MYKETTQEQLSNADLLAQELSKKNTGSETASKALVLLTEAFRAGLEAGVIFRAGISDKAG